MVALTHSAEVSPSQKESEYACRDRWFFVLSGTFYLSTGILIAKFALAWLIDSFIAGFLASIIGGVFVVGGVGLIFHAFSL